MKNFFKSTFLIILLLGLLTLTWSLLFEFLLVKADEGVTLQTSVQTYLAVVIDSNTVNMGNLQPGTPVTGQSTITVTTNNNVGYQIQIKRNNSDQTLKKGSDFITDKTAWDPAANSGNGNAAVWTSTGLGFRIKQTNTTSNYNATWWGSDDTDRNAQFAGFPSTSKQIMNRTTYSQTSTVTEIGHKVDVPNTQATGGYSGGITFSTVAN
ncbi:hypothetical protein IID20_01960 [Patescibacteria group bacterium]|nr:hypothetical protein [Patescibacteria group bacterium]